MHFVLWSYETNLNSVVVAVELVPTQHGSREDAEAGAPEADPQ